MADFCKDCFIKKLTTPSNNITDKMLVMSDTWEFCEGCCEVKPIVTSVENNETHQDSKYTTDIPDHYRDFYYELLIEEAIKRFEAGGEWKVE